MDPERCEDSASQAPYTGRNLPVFFRFMKRYIPLFSLAVVYRRWKLMCELMWRLARGVKRAVHVCVYLLHDLGQRWLILTWHYICKRTSHAKDVVRLFGPPSKPDCEKDMKAVLCLLALPGGPMSVLVIPYKRLPPWRTSRFGQPSPMEEEERPELERKAGVAATKRFFTMLERTCKGHCPFKWKIWQLMGFGVIHLKVQEAKMSSRSGNWETLSPPPHVEPFDYSEIKADQERKVNNERLDEDRTPSCAPYSRYHDQVCIHLQGSSVGTCSSEAAEEARAVLCRLADPDLIEVLANTPVETNHELEDIFVFSGESIYPHSWENMAWMGWRAILRRGEPFSGLSIQPKFIASDPTSMSFRAAFLIVIIVVMWRIGSGDWGDAFNLGCFLLIIKYLGP